MSKKIAIITGSTRPSRIGLDVSNWVVSKLPEGAEYEVVDLANWNLPMLDEPKEPSKGDYVQDHTKKWSAKISEFDGYIVISPEYNAGYPAPLKNAIDYLYSEWTDKPVAIVTYGWGGGASANNQLDEVFTRLKAKVVPTKPKLAFGEDPFNQDGKLKDIELSFGPFADEVAKATQELISA